VPTHTLRIVSVNDVYSLENLPRLKTLVRHYIDAYPNDALIVPLAGDFVGPSLLSSIDAGRGMVDCLNDVGITHVILGNHEDDIPIDELRSRLTELKPVCLGTNIRGGISGVDLPAHAVIEVATKDFLVGLVGVVMADEAVYRGKPFGGADVVNANAAAIEEAERLLKNPSCKAVVPITHQSIADDRVLAKATPAGKRFPVIIGGHEHTPMLVNVDGTWIVKAGAEAVHAVITEIVWSTTTTPTAGGGAPTVSTRLDDVSQYAEDPDLLARVERHMSRVRELEAATLLHVPTGTPPLSSVGTRWRQTSMGTLICNALRDALEADACLFNGGGIRASREYPERLTYGDVEAEVPFDNEVVVVTLTGRDVRDAVAASRAKAPYESGSFLQVDDRMVVGDGSEGPNTVTAIAGAPLGLDREYKVALIRELLLGLDRVEPLVLWAKANPALVPPVNSGREPKMVLVQSFALAIWRELGGFDAVDSDHNDRVTATEIATAVARANPSQAPSAVLADLVMRAVDANADQVITREDDASTTTEKTD
jgi:2',3'-cyclic-nucleotide 2'-phosphodiesterase (5'-nucleotidase family)